MIPSGFTNHSLWLAKLRWAKPPGQVGRIKTLELKDSGLQKRALNSRMAQRHSLKSLQNSHRLLHPLTVPDSELASSSNSSGSCQGTKGLLYFRLSMERGWLGALGPPNLGTQMSHAILGGNSTPCPSGEQGQARRDWKSCKPQRALLQVEVTEMN